MKIVRMLNRFFRCCISNENPLARMCAKKILVPLMNSTHLQLSLEKKIKFQKAFVRILKLFVSPTLIRTVDRGVL